MEIRWGNIIFVAVLVLTIACVLWLRSNADAVDDAWDSFVDGLSDLFDNFYVQGFTYLALALGLLLFAVWLFSRVVRWFRG